MISLLMDLPAVYFNGLPDPKEIKQLQFRKKTFLRTLKPTDKTLAKFLERLSHSFECLRSVVSSSCLFNVDNEETNDKVLYSQTTRFYVACSMASGTALPELLLAGGGHI